MAQDSHGAGVDVISARAETNYAELIAESPVAGFLAKSEPSADGIAQILGR